MELSKVFGFEDMEYFAGIKLFNNVIDRLGVDIDRQDGMKYLTGFMRKECVRKRSSKVGIADRVNNLGAMAWM